MYRLRPDDRLVLLPDHLDPDTRPSELCVFTGLGVLASGLYLLAGLPDPWCLATPDPPPFQEEFGSYRDGLDADVLNTAAAVEVEAEAEAEVRAEPAPGDVFGTMLGFTAMPGTDAPCRCVPLVYDGRLMFGLLA